MATGALFGSPVFQFVDASGVPLAGGSLQFYATGTTTPLAVYADIALSTPLTNPVPLNSGGFAPQIFLQDLEYAVVLSDVDGNQIWTADPLTGTGSFTTTVMVSGSGAIGFQASNTTADGQTWAVLSNTDGSLSIKNVSTGAVALSIAADSQISTLAGIDATSTGNVGDTYTSTAATGQSWSWTSTTSGSFQAINYSVPAGSLYLLPSGAGVMPFDMNFESTVEIEGLATLTGGVNIETGALTVTASSTFTAVATFEANLASTSTAGFSGATGFTGGINPVVTGTQSVGVEAINTGTTGRGWGWLSAASGQFQAYDFTAALVRFYFDANGIGYFQQPVQFPGYSVAGLPLATNLSIGCMAFALNGRNTGEAAAAGTGCLVQVQSKSGVLTWCAVWSGVQVTA